MTRWPQGGAFSPFLELVWTCPQHPHPQPPPTMEPMEVLASPGAGEGWEGWQGSEIRGCQGWEVRPRGPVSIRLLGGTQDQGWDWTPKGRVLDSGWGCHRQGLPPGPHKAMLSRTLGVLDQPHLACVPRTWHGIEPGAPTGIPTGGGVGSPNSPGHLTALASPLQLGLGVSWADKARPEGEDPQTHRHTPIRGH